MKFQSESEFIAKLRGMARTSAAGLIKGIGDDAAIVDTSTSFRWCITTDLLLEGIHFDLRFDSAESVGYKSLAAGLSDIAAMGATPRFALVSIAVPSAQAGAFLPPFYKGWMRLARRHQVSLIGGDTSRSSGRVFIDVIVLGCARRGREVERRGARAGDAIFVTGNLGKAAWGLSLLKSGRPPASVLERRAVRSHLFPTPRTAVGRWLGQHRIASAMIDVSDGLSTDLNHLCEESGVGAVVFKEYIPLPCERRSADLLAKALSGGEDYELLFTVSRSKARRLASRIEGVPIHQIGSITPPTDGLIMIGEDGQRRKLIPSGWDHFR